MSRINESCHVWISCVTVSHTDALCLICATHEWVMPRLHRRWNQSLVSCVAYAWVMSLMTEWVMFRVNISRRYVTCDCYTRMSLHTLCHTWMLRAHALKSVSWESCQIQMRRVTCDSVMSHINMWLSHVACLGSVTDSHWPYCTTRHMTHMCQTWLICVRHATWLLFVSCVDQSLVRWGVLHSDESWHLWLNGSWVMSRVFGQSQLHFKTAISVIFWLLPLTWHARTHTHAHARTQGTRRSICTSSTRSPKRVRHVLLATLFLLPASMCHSTLCLSLYIELCVTCEWVVSRINASRSQMNETNSHMDALLVTLFLLPASMCPSRLSYCSHMNESFHSWMRYSHTWVCQSHTWMHYWWRSSCGPQVCVTLDWVFRHIEMSRVTH